MIEMTVVLPRRRGRQTRRLTALLIVQAREAEMRNLHAQRDGCLLCGIRARISRDLLIPAFPRWLRNDEAMHRRIVMPAMRELARIEQDLHR